MLTELWEKPSHRPSRSFNGSRSAAGLSRVTGPVMHQKQNPTQGGGRGKPDSYKAKCSPSGLGEHTEHTSMVHPRLQPSLQEQRPGDRRVEDTCHSGESR